MVAEGEYDVLIEKEFNATSFANDLLLATNSNENELDISTSIKRVKFDLKDIDSKLDKICGEEHQELIGEIEKSSEVSQLFTQLQPSLNHANNLYQRLEKDIVSPYNDAMKAQDALKRIHSTSYLLRGITYFLYLVQQIEELSSNPEQFLDQNSLSSAKLLKLANFNKNLKQHLINNPNLKSLKITRDYEHIGFQKRERLIPIVQQFLKNVTENNFGSYQDSDLQNYFRALYILDESKFIQTFGIIMDTQVNVSINLLAKTLTSPRNFDNTMCIISKKGELINNISTLLQKVHANDDTVDDVVLSNVLLEKYQVDKLVSIFWRDLAKNFENRFKETVQRGGPVAKSLISYKEQLKKSIKQNVLKSNPIDLKQDGIEVRMMLNSIAILDKTTRHEKIK